MILNKQSLRITCRKVRAKIVNKQEQSQKIIKELAKLPIFSQASSILGYYPLENEVDILPFLKKLKKTKLEVYLPFFDNLDIGSFDNSLRFVDKFNSYEPLVPVKDIALDVIIIPALAYDRRGYRLGQGMGWYDRFLITHPEAFKVGVCFQEQLHNKIPNNEKDQRVDMIISSEEVIICE
jgi:5-formyltetrahydrofolate cyclo-ligase